MKYKHLTVDEREKIQELLWQKKSIRHIAGVIGRPPSSISREIKRNKPPERNVYTPRLAEERAQEKRTSRGRKGRLKNETVRGYVKEKLEIGWSPEQIAGCMQTDIGQSVSHEAIYQYIYSQFKRRGYGRCVGIDLRGYLKRRHKQRHAHGARKHQRVLKAKGTSIEQRPKIVDLRTRIGDWEGDSIVSRKSKVALNTLVERRTGMVFITRVHDGTAKETEQAVIKRLRMLPPSLRLTLTIDNGSENQCHEELEQALGLDCYFAHPYSSYERGTNENTNGLIRWYFPKGTDFATISDEEILRVELALNSRPRKRLGYKSPLQVLSVALAC